MPAPNPIDYLDVLFAQRDLLDARRVLIETKREQLSAIVNTYQALGGGGYLLPIPVPKPLQSHPWWHHLKLTRASKEAEGATKPVPAPAAPERAPEAIPDLEPLPAIAARGPAPLPATDPARSPEPPAITTEGGTGSAHQQRDLEMTEPRPVGVKLETWRFSRRSRPVEIRGAPASGTVQRESREDGDRPRRR